VLRRLLRKIKFFMQRNFENNKPLSSNQLKTSLSKKLNTNLENIKNILNHSSDVAIRLFDIGSDNKSRAAIAFIDGLVDKSTINEYIMKSLMLDSRTALPTPLTGKKDMLGIIKKNILTAAELREVKTFEELIYGMLSGEVVLIVDGYDTAFIIGAKGWESRGVQEPNTETVVRGPREGFTENLRTNTAMLRRRLKSPNLVFEHLKIGRVTNTDVCIVYIRGITNIKIVQELRRRLNRIDIDGILESGYIEQLIEDAPFSIFPTIGNTERPDKVAAKLLEGRVAVLTDGSPMALTLPYLFMEGIQSSEDYYSRTWFSTIVRWIRIAALIITILLPPLYIAGQSYHQEMIPTVLLLTMAAAKEGIPFPVFIETLLMGISFEMLKEAGVRMPRPIGHAISIVGALVLGEAAVNAGVVSAPAVIVTAITGIAGFIIPTHNDSFPILRLVFAILAAIAGLFGLLLGIVFLLIHLVSLRSFGIPYLSPIAPGIIQDLKDTAIRAPLWAMYKRPRAINRKNPVRLGADEPSQPPEDKEKDG